jgi:hypothetical protein
VNPLDLDFSFPNIVTPGFTSYQNPPLPFQNSENYNQVPDGSWFLPNAKFPNAFDCFSTHHFSDRGTDQGSSQGLNHTPLSVYDPDSCHLYRPEIPPGSGFSCPPTTTTSLDLQLPTDLQLLSQGMLPDTEHLHTRISPSYIISEIQNTPEITSVPSTKNEVRSGPAPWDNISSKEFKPNGSRKDVKVTRKAGRRRGHLAPETAKKAQKMRHIRACLPCSILKITVTSLTNVEQIFG